MRFERCATMESSLTFLALYVVVGAGLYIGALLDNKKTRGLVGERPIRHLGIHGTVLATLTGAGLVGAGLSASALGDTPTECWPALSKGMGPFPLLAFTCLFLFVGRWGLLALWRLAAMHVEVSEESEVEEQADSRLQRFNPWGHVPLTVSIMRNATGILLVLFPVIVLQVIAVADIRCPMAT